MSVATAALVVGALAAVGGAYEAKRSGEFARKSAKKQEQRFLKKLGLEREEEKRAAKQSAILALRGREGRRRELSPREEIKTSPLGIPGQATGAAKTLLGQ